MLALMCFSMEVFSQTKDYEAYPYWIDMIDNPNANMFEANKAYDLYWKQRIKPLDEEEELFDEMSETEKLQFEVLKKHLSTMTPSERQEFDRIKYHVKRFKQWRRDMKPYVQEDGSILSPEERIKIWKDLQSQGKK